MAKKFVAWIGWRLKIPVKCGLRDQIRAPAACVTPIDLLVEDRFRMRQETGDASKMRCGLGFRRFGSGRVHFRDFEAPMPEMPFFARYIKGLGIATRAPGHRLPDRVISRGLRKFACHAMGRTESAYFTGQTRVGMASPWFAGPTEEVPHFRP